MTENNTEPNRTPRWVWVFAIVGLILIVLVVVMLIAGQGGHGPGRHALEARELVAPPQLLRM